jgi:carbon monoxide dehydrogenase subunit G
VKVERSIEIAATPREVYDLIMDPQRLEDWVTIHHSLDEAPDGQLRKGSHLKQCLKLAGRKLHVDWQVVENEPCERVVWEGRGPVHSHARAVYELAPDGDDGTKFSYTNEYDLPGGPLGRMAGGAVKRVTAKELDGSLAQLKRLAESVGRDS